MTFLFDPAKAMEALSAYEKQWGGTAVERMAAKYSAYENKYGDKAPKPADERAVADAVGGAAPPTVEPVAPLTGAASPPAEAEGPSLAPSPPPATNQD